MGYEPAKPKIEMQEIRYYLDAQQQDHIDRGSLHSKYCQILELRSRLLSLPQPDFETAMLAMRRIVVNSPENKDDKARDQMRRSNAATLYDLSNKPTDASSSGKAIQAI